MSSSHPVEMFEDPEARRRVEQRCRTLGIDAAHQLIVIHVGAGNEFRRWPEASFADVAAGLASGQPNRRIILTTGPAQAARAEEVRRAALGLGVEAGAIAVDCDLGLGELRVLIARASLFLGGDSGPARTTRSWEWS